jgi:hypothetical protein
VRIQVASGRFHYRTTAAPNAITRDIARIVVPRTLFFWALVHLVAALSPDIVRLLGPSESEAITPTPMVLLTLKVAAMLVNALLVAALVGLDMRATKQRLLLANLGIGLRGPLALAFGLEVVYAVGEALFRWAA